MGGHNVIETEAGKVGVRTDQMRVLPASDPVPDGHLARPAVVSDVEYQGTYVLLGLQNPAVARSANSTAEASVMLSESLFARRPYAVGDAVQMTWARDAAHALAA